MITKSTVRAVKSSLVLMMPVAVLLGTTTTASAAYRVFATTEGSSSIMLDRGDSFELEIWLVPDNEEKSNSVILQVVFSDVGLSYDSLEWHGVFRHSRYEDSTPGDGELPLVLDEGVLSGPGHPAGIVDIELSHAVLDAFCVGPDNESSGLCECPEGRCIGSTCVGGPYNGEGCALPCGDGECVDRFCVGGAHDGEICAPCLANEQCERLFDTGRMATLTLTVPADFAGPDRISIDVVPDTVANGFDELDAAPCAPFQIYLDCVAPGDTDCDGRATLTDYAEWTGCMTGPGGTATSFCTTFDFDGDQDVDLIDWSVFHGLLDAPCRPRCTAPGDIDCDGWVTLGDYSQWVDCMTGPGGSSSSLCDNFDLDWDGDSDLADWRAFSLLLEDPSGVR